MAATLADWVAIGIRLRLHNHAQQQLAIFLAFQQQATDEVWSNNLRWTAEEELGEVLETSGDIGHGGSGSSLGDRSV